MSLYRYSKIEKDYKHYLECTQLLPKVRRPYESNPEVTSLLYPEEFTLNSIEQSKVLIGERCGVLIILGNSVTHGGGYPYNVRLINIVDYKMLTHLSAVDKEFPKHKFAGVVCV